MSNTNFGSRTPVGMLLNDAIETPKATKEEVENLIEDMLHYSALSNDFMNEHIKRGYRIESLGKKSSEYRKKMKDKKKELISILGE